MFIYRFHFSEEAVQVGEVDEFLEFLEAQAQKLLGTLNYLPSKQRIVASFNNSITNVILDWAEHNAEYSFEYEEHSEFERLHIQIDINNSRKEVYKQYLLPLFPLESYLEL